MTWEVINDLMAITTVYASGRLWGSQVARGFYYPIFSTYDQTPSKMPFGTVLLLSVPHASSEGNWGRVVMIQQAVQDISTKATTTAITHITVSTS